MTPRRILFLTADRNGPSFRFRVEQYLQRFANAGVQAEIAELNVPFRTRWQTLWRAADYDVVCIHRAFLSPTELAVLRRRARRLVYDFDDAILFRDSAAPRLRSWQRAVRFKRVVRAADDVIAGNAYLATFAALHNPRTLVIPSTVEMSEYPDQRVGDGDSGVIGWMGSRANMMYLKTITPALQRIANRLPHVRLRIVSDDFIDLPGIRSERKPWSRAEEAADLAAFQVGIMPLDDDSWTRGKCGVKALQYHAARVPLVCSPVGANNDIVEHGHSGYFATGPDEWVERLSELLLDAGKRQQFANAGRATVAAHYSAEQWFPKLLAAIRDGSAHRTRQ